MIRVLLFLGLCPALLSAQDTYVGIRAGRNVAQVDDELTRSGLVVGAFAQASVSRHIGLEWSVDWMRSAVEDFDMTSVAPPPPVEPAYLTTSLVARVATSRSFFDAFPVTLGAAASGGGWLGARSGGDANAGELRRFDFGQVWGVSVFGIRGAVKLEVALHAYHGEREVWDRGPRQRGSRALLGIAYRIR